MTDALRAPAALVIQSTGLTPQPVPPADARSSRRAR
ncbi:MAG: hypothetical protein JWR85_3399 [Marmoricola sp.]|nr:hypothetical protein [Marmoricola sp.]